MKACWSAACWCEGGSSVELKWPQLTLSLIQAENQQRPKAETTAGARLRAVQSPCPVSSARERTDDNQTHPPHQQSACHWAAAIPGHPPRPNTNIDIAAVRNAHSDITRRAQHRSTFEIHIPALWIRTRKTAFRAACLPRALPKMPGKVLGATRLAGEEGRETSTLTWARLAGESGLRKKEYRKNDTDVAAAKLELS